MGSVGVQAVITPQCETPGCIRGGVHRIIVHKEVPGSALRLVLVAAWKWLCPGCYNALTD